MPELHRRRIAVRRIRARHWGVALLALVVTGVLALGGLTVRTGDAAVAVTPATPAAATTSANGAITLEVTTTAGTSTLPASGGSVTYTYTVRNDTTAPAYYRSLIDTECSTPGYTGSGMTNDGTRWWIPAGGTATFTCGSLVTQTTTSTATAVFDTSPDGKTAWTATTVSTTTTVAVADNPCTTIWYAAENTPIASSTPTATGTFGTVSTSGGTPTYAPKFSVSTATGGAVNGSSAFAVDPSDPSTAWFIGNVGGTLKGLYRLDTTTGIARLTTGTSAATTTYRLSAGKDGTLWSWATDGNLYALRKGATTWTRYAIGSITDVYGRTLSATGFQSGDLAVGGNGNLWLLAADQTSRTTYLLTIPAGQLTTGGTPLRATLVGKMTSPSNGGFYNGIDFGADGVLYASTGPNTVGTGASGGPNQLYAVNMATGASTLVSSTSTAGVGSVGDLGSCALPRSDLRVLKTVSSATPAVKSGDVVTYTIRVANLGSLAAVGATLQDAIPANTTYVAASTTLDGVAVADVGGAMPYTATAPALEVHSAGANPGVIAANSSAVVRFSVRVNADLDPSVTKISNRATVVDVNGVESSDDPTRPGAKDTTDISIARAGIAVTKSADRTSVTGSGDVAYTFVVRNTGTEPLARVTLTDAATSTRTGSTADHPSTACAAPTLDPASDGNGNGRLDVDEIWLYRCTEPVSWATGDADTWTLADTATVTGVGTVTGVTVDGRASASVAVAFRPPTFDVTKEAGAVVGPDTESGVVEARYTVTVRNVGDKPGTYGRLLDTPVFPSPMRILGAKVMAADATRWTDLTGAGPFPLSTGGTLGAGETHEYRVVIRAAYTQPASVSPVTGCAKTPTPGQGLYNAAAIDGATDPTLEDAAVCIAPPTQPDPKVDLQKIASGPIDTDHDGVVSAGDTITYAFVVTNRGSTTLRDVAVTDPLLGGVTCAETVLSPAAATRCTASSLTVSPTDIDAGRVTNTATAAGTPPYMAAVTARASTTTALPAPSRLALTKEVTSVTDPQGTPRTGTPLAGDLITYRFTVRNDGQTTLSGLTVEDARVANLRCAASTLPAGGSTTCDADPYVVTATDATAGSVVNVATAKAARPDGTPQTAEASTTTLIAPANPRISLTKTFVGTTDSAPEKVLDPGDTMTYRLTVTNVGNVPVRAIHADDTTLGLTGLSCRNELLAPGDSVDCGLGGSTTVTVPIGQKALDAGTLTNEATAHAYDPLGGTEITATAGVTVDLTAQAGFTNDLSLTKKAGAVVDENGNGHTDVGDAIGYAFQVTNTGSQTLDLLEVDDTGLVTTSLTCEFSLLRSGESTVCLSRIGHLISAEEMKAGEYVNTAVARAVTAVGRTSVSSRPATATKTLDNTPRITVEKIAGPVTEGAGFPAGHSRGDTITYTFRITNTGGVPVTSVSIADARLGWTAQDCGLTAPLAPGDSATCTATGTLTLTRADVTAGQVTNTATATATSVYGTTATDDTATTTPLTPAPGVTLEKTHDGGDTPRRVGDKITYSFLVRNSGVGTLSNIRITDARLGLDAVPCTSTDATLPATGTPDTADDSAYALACTVTDEYTVTQADVDGGRVDNTATVTASFGSDTVTAEAADSVPTEAGAPAIRLVKSAGPVTDVDGDGIDAGDTLTYTFEVTNTGGTTLQDVLVSDTLLGLTADRCAAGPVAPGDTVRCDRTSTLTDAQITAGRVTNTATASATPTNGGDPVTSTDDVTVALARTPHLALQKRADLADTNGNGLADAPEAITYTFVVTNVGTGPVEKVTLTDATLGSLTPHCPPTRLEPGDTVECGPAVWRVTGDDVARGGIVNVATAAAVLAGTDVVTPESPPAQATVETGPAPTEPPAPGPAPTPDPAPGGLRLTKTAVLTEDDGTPGVADAGDEITYGFVVVNTSGQTVPSVTVVDPRLSSAPITCPSGELAPGAAVTCTTLPYTVTAGDVTAARAGGGTILNTAFATGGGLTSPEARATVPVAPSAPDPSTGPDPTAAPTTNPTPLPVPGAVSSVSMTKSFAWSDGASRTSARVGDGIVYTFTVVNTGTVPVWKVTVDDPRLAGLGIDVPCPAGRLEPGRSVRCTATAPYRITAQDAARGRVLNTAVARAVSPGGPTRTDPTAPGAPQDTVAIPVDGGAAPSPAGPDGPTPRPHTGPSGHAGESTRPGGPTRHGRLPFTGTQATALATTGLVLVGAGAGAVLLSRRRRR